MKTNMRLSNLKLVLSAMLIVFAVVFSSRCQTLSKSETGPECRILSNISYVPGSSNPAHLLDVYLPSKTDRKVPLIIWIHGGGWLFGTKADTPAKALVPAGFAVASINYRLSPEATFPAQLDDCKAAVRFLRKHAPEYNIAPGKIGVFGMSAGGHLVALLGTTGDIKNMEGTEGNPDVSSKVQAVCDWCGPTDLITIASQGGPTNQLKLDSEDGAVAKLLGGLPARKKELAEKASPVRFISKDDPPFLIVHGDADTVVPMQQSEEFYQALKEAGLDAELTIVKGAHHVFQSPETLDQAVHFFKQKLGS